MSAPCINAMYVHSTSMGYGRFGTYVTQGLEERGIQIFDHLPMPNEPKDGIREVAYSTDGTRTGLAKVACWFSVPTHARGWYKDQIPLLFTMFESQRIPESFRKVLHEFKTVIVPSDHNVELFSKYHPDVRACYLGVDPKQWFFLARKAPEVFFTFLIGGSGPRKGTDLAYKAFRTLWPKEGSWSREGPVPRLVMKNPRGEQYYGERVEMVTGKISGHAEVDLYANAHCYLQPSRGEGFGLQPLQALAQGCPTILTAAHGHGSFAHLGYGLDSKPSHSAYFIYGDAGDWWEPDFDQLCDYMKYVYENYDEAVQKGVEAAETVAKEFTWGNTVDRFLEIVGPENLVPYTGSKEWYEPRQRRYRIVTNQDWSCQAAGIQYRFKAGQEYYEVADIKRLLFEANLLTPECVNADDHGLALEQIHDLAEYTAANSHCHACGQQLNTRPTYADQIMEKLELNDTSEPSKEWIY